MKKLIFLISLILCLGCNKDIHYVVNAPVMNFEKLAGVGYNEVKIVRIDENFSLAEKESIKSAILDWEYSLNGRVRFQFLDLDMGNSLADHVGNHDWLIMKIDESSGFKPVDKEGVVTIAFVDKVGGDKLFVIGKRVKNKDLKGVIVHEVGHLLGIRHIRGGIMDPIYSGYVCIDEEVMKEFGDLKSYNYCVL